MTTPVGSSEADPRPTAGARRRPRGLVPSEPDLPRRAPEPPAPYVLSIPAPPRLPARPWRAAKTAVALLLLLALALFAFVQAIRTFASVIDDGSETVADYADGDIGVEVRVSDRFTALLPTEPRRVTVPVPGAQAGDGRRASSLVAEVDGTEFAITWFDLDGDVTDAGTVLSLLAGATAEQLGGTLEDRGMQPTGTVAQHQFVVQRADGTDHVAHLLVGRSVYQLRVSGTVAHGDAFSRLLSSFEPQVGG